MDAYIYMLHLQAGVAAGEERTCGNKQKHENEQAAAKAAASLNRSNKARHEVEPYPCAFCKDWHIGRKMSEEELRGYAGLIDDEGE